MVRWESDHLGSADSQHWVAASAHDFVAYPVTQALAGQQTSLEGSQLTSHLSTVSANALITYRCSGQDPTPWQLRTSMNNSYLK